RPGAPRPDHPARAGAHVVRGPGDDALVGRPVAERVLRGVRLHPGQCGGHPVESGMDHLRGLGEGLGLPPGPAALDPPGRGRHGRPRGGRDQLRRHHLCQGRLGAAPAGGLRRHRGVLRRGARLLHAPCLGQHRAAGSAGRARGHQRPGPAPVVPAVVADLRGEHAASAPGAGRGRCPDPFRDRPGGPRGAPHPAPPSAARGGFSLEGGKLVRTAEVELDVDGELTEVPELAGARADLWLLNDGDLAYTKVRLDPHSLAMAMKHLRDLDDPLARTLLWSATWDMVRDGELPSRRYQQLVLANITAEPSSSVVRTLLQQLELVAGPLAAPDQRIERTAAAADAVWELTGAADAGSDAQ